MPALPLLPQGALEKAGKLVQCSSALTVQDLLASVDPTWQLQGKYNRWYMNDETNI
jgi:hypothetical protein